MSGRRGRIGRLGMREPRAVAGRATIAGRAVARRVAVPRRADAAGAGWVAAGRRGEGGA
jgi:hypothetical protein